MPVNPDTLLNWKFEDLVQSYTARDTMLYALGVGAGADPMDEGDLKFVYEENLCALPTYAVVLGYPGFWLKEQNTGADWRKVLHGEQGLVLHRPLPAAGTMIGRTRVTGFIDKGEGKGALLITAREIINKDKDELVATVTSTSFLRGDGGTGVVTGPAATPHALPERAPDATLDLATAPNAALIYRLSGDWNPLHVDPEFATMFGFQKPILHGLCTFGFVGRAVVNAFSKGDPRFFKSIKVRFADSVYPGETLKIEMWKENDLRIIVRATVVEREKVCISNAAVELYAEIPKPKSKEVAKAAPAAAQAPKLDAATTFNAIGAYLGQHPELVKSVGNVYQFRLKNPDSAWVLDLKNGGGSVKAGTVDKADCTLDLSDSDWLDMVSGKADPMKLFQGGKLKISGNVMASQKLDFLKKIDRKEFESALGSAPATAAPAPTAAPAAGAKAPIILAALKDRLAKNPALAKEVGAVITFKVKDGPSFTADLASATPTIKDGADAKATTTITLSDDALAEFAKTGAAQTLYQHGDVRIDGSVKPVHRLGFFKQLV